MIRTIQETAKTWYLFIDILRMLKDTRSSLDQPSEFKVAAINASILIHIAAIVEGAINSLLTIKLQNNKLYRESKIKNEFDVIRIFESQLDLLQKSTWNTLSEEHSKTILGFKLKEIYQENWPAIKHLFEFRNILAHGGLVVKKTDKISEALEVTEVKNERTEESLTKKQLFEFLLKKRLIDDSDDLWFLKWQFINTKTINYFELHAKNFLEEIYNRYSEGNPIDIFTRTDIKMISEI